MGQLTGTVKNYDWGGTSFIPSLLNITNEPGKPFAEYWLGIHPQADCRLMFNDGSSALLRDYLTSDLQAALGDSVFKKFHNIPFLLKTLDVKDMLSIQVHPSKAAAEKDFAEENSKGIPLDSPERNYKDNNHKPELAAAVGEFWLLHGFKPEEEMRGTLEKVPELRSLLAVFEIDGYRGLYKTVMEMPQEEVNSQLQPLLDRIIPLYQKNKLEKSGADFWAARAALTFSQPGKTDRGIFSVYLFNLVHLQKGQAIFQDAGVPHAYLEGQNVEIMSSSDNVLRGGLTHKHIDVKELLKHVKCVPTYPNILDGDRMGNGLVYKTPAPDFELSAYDLARGENFAWLASTAEIILLIEGEVTISSKEGNIFLKRGTPAAIVFPGDEIAVSAKEKSLIFKAGVPGQ